MDLKVYRFVAHFGAASDGGVISWARRPPLRGLAPALGESRRADCGRRVARSGPCVQLTIRRGFAYLLLCRLWPTTYRYPSAAAL